MSQIPYGRDETAALADRSSGYLWVEAADVAPLLQKAAGSEAARRAVQEKLGFCIDPNVPGGRIRLSDYFRLIRAHAAVSLEESLGLAPRPLVSGTTDFVMAQASLGDTLQDAMRYMARAYNKLHGGEYNFIDVSADECAFRVDDTAFPYTRPADFSVTFMLECVIICLHGAFCAITGEDLTPFIRRVATRRPERSAHDPLTFWACPVNYDAPCYAIAYAAEVGALPIKGFRPSEAMVHNRILALIENREAELSAQPIFAARVRQALRDGARDQEEVAHRLGCSVATLRRRLTLEGESFRTLRRDYLNEAAKLHLLQAERVADVANDLGFSDSRSFTRAFKGWNGQSPQSYRSGLKPVR